MTLRTLIYNLLKNLDDYLVSNVTINLHMFEGGKDNTEVWIIKLMITETDIRMDLIINRYDYRGNEYNIYMSPHKDYFDPFGPYDETDINIKNLKQISLFDINRFTYLDDSLEDIEDINITNQNLYDIIDTIDVNQVIL